MLGLSSITAAILAVTAQGQSQSKLPPINPDRPDFTDSAYIIPKGTWQTELGIRRSRADGIVDDWGNQPLFRYGVNSRFELRLALPSNIAARSQLGPQVGFGDGYAGFKYRFKEGVDNKTPSLAAIMTATVPSKGQFSERKIQTQFVFVVDQTLGVYGLQLNFAYSYLSNGGMQFPQYSATYSLGYPIKGKLNGFFEGVYVSAQNFRGPRGGLFDGGLNYLVTNDFMVDCSVGQGVNGLRRDWFIGVGLSYRF